MRTYKIEKLPPSVEANMLQEIEARGWKFWNKHYPNDPNPAAMTVLFLGVASYIEELERKINGK